MAETKKLTNSVKVVGYLKENNLEKVTNTRGDSVIRGNIIVAVDDISSHKIQFYVAETTSKGEKSKDYEGLSNLLPDNTITVASFLKENPSADFKTAANASSKVWVMARFEEYAKRVDKKESSLITLKGFRAGFSTAGKPFVPCAEFTTDVYVSDLTEEDNGSGRIVLEGLIPMYDKSMQKITFVAPVEDNIASYIKDNYKVGDTVTLKGDVVSIQERKLSEDSDSGMFGRGSGPQYETKFIRERVIRGGSATPIHQGEDGCIPAADVKGGLAARDLKMDSNGAKAATRSSNSGFTSAPVAKPTRSIPEDVDF